MDRHVDWLRRRILTSIAKQSAGTLAVVAVVVFLLLKVVLGLGLVAALFFALLLGLVAAGARVVHARANNPLSASDVRQYISRPFAYRVTKFEGDEVANPVAEGLPGFRPVATINDPDENLQVFDVYNDPSQLVAASVNRSTGAVSLMSSLDDGRTLVTSAQLSPPHEQIVLNFADNASVASAIAAHRRVIASQGDITPLSGGAYEIVLEVLKCEYDSYSELGANLSPFFNPDPEPARWSQLMSRVGAKELTQLSEDMGPPLATATRPPVAPEVSAGPAVTQITRNGEVLGAATAPAEPVPSLDVPVPPITVPVVEAPIIDPVDVAMPDVIDHQLVVTDPVPHVVEEAAAAVTSEVDPLSALPSVPVLDPVTPAPAEPAAVAPTTPEFTPEKMPAVAPTEPTPDVPVVEMTPAAVVAPVDTEASEPAKPGLPQRAERAEADEPTKPQATKPKLPQRGKPAAATESSLPRRSEHTVESLAEVEWATAEEIAAKFGVPEPLPKDEAPVVVPEPAPVAPARIEQIEWATAEQLAATIGSLEKQVADEPEPVAVVEPAPVAEPASMVEPAPVAEPAPAAEFQPMQPQPMQPQPIHSEPTQPESVQAVPTVEPSSAPATYAEAVPAAPDTAEELLNHTTSTPVPSAESLLADVPEPVLPDGVHADPRHPMHTEPVHAEPVPAEPIVTGAATLGFGETGEKPIRRLSEALEARSTDDAAAAAAFGKRRRR
jgi:hypothetical protein